MIRAFLLAAVALTLAAAPARAGTYTVHNCETGFAGTGSWVPSQSGPTTISSGCPMKATFSGASEGASGATWTFTAPGGTTITAATLDREMTRGSSRWRVVITASGADDEVTTTCSSSICPEATRAVSLADNTTSITVGVVCAGSCGNGSGWITVYGADITISAPAPTLTLGGPLADGAWHQGTEPVVVNATDASGIAAAGVELGSSTVGAVSRQCDWTLAQPCPNTPVTVPVSGLPEGTFPLTAYASDAGKEKASSTFVVHIDRTAPTAPTAAAVTPNPDGTFAVSWTDPDQGAAAPIAGAHYAVCDGAACGTDTFVAGAGLTKLSGLTLPSGAHTLRVWLQDAAGNADPSSAATIAFTGPQTTTTPGQSIALNGDAKTVTTLPPVLKPANLSPAHLRLAHVARSGAKLTVSGTIARGAKNGVRIDVAGTRTGKALVRGRATPRGGTFKATLRLPKALRGRRVYLTLSFPGQANMARATVRHTVS